MIIVSKHGSFFHPKVYVFKSAQHADISARIRQSDGRGLFTEHGNRTDSL